MYAEHRHENAETGFDPRSKAALVQFLQSKDPHERYTYSDCRKCLSAQYFDSIGQGYYVRDGFHADQFDRFVERCGMNGYGPNGAPHTFGHALTYALAHEPGDEPPHNATIVPTRVVEFA